MGKRGEEMNHHENFIGISKWKLDTPCLVIDKDILKQNIQTMQAHAGAYGKQIRPHAKTHKCSHVAKMQTEAGCAGICVAKVGEAEGLVQKGLRGVLITSPVVTDYKIERLMKCLSLDREIMVVVDNAANARKLNEAVEKLGGKLNVLVDLDPGMGRTGVAFQEGLAMGQLITRLPALRLRGIQCYAGHVQHIVSFEERRRSSLAWMEQAAGVVRQFRQNGLPGDIFTGAGTGTFEIDCRIPELTDMQVGSYTVMDAEYLGIGSSQDPSRFNRFPPGLDPPYDRDQRESPEFCHRGCRPEGPLPSRGNSDRFKRPWVGFPIRMVRGRARENRHPPLVAQACPRGCIGTGRFPL